MIRLRRFYWLAILLILISCQDGAAPQLTPTSPPDADSPTAVPASSEPAPAPSVAPMLPPDTVEEQTPTSVGEPTWPTPAPPPGRFDAIPITGEEVVAGAALADVRPPARDDVALAREYEGVTELQERPGAAASFSVGDTRQFTVLKIDNNTVVPIEAALLGVSEHAYFWFDLDAPQPAEQALIPVGEAFDAIYETNVAAFGEERRPGIDGDERLHIVHASPGALCLEADNCGLAGYFSGMDALPAVVNEQSNELDMFVMNANNFGTNFYLNVLAHEFRHMIEDNHDVADADWEIEGSATLAEELNGYTANAHNRGNAFLSDPDQQLNRWTDGNTTTYYGQGYVLNRYIYDRLGPELYRAFATHPADGLDAVTAVAAAHGLHLTGEALWRDWLATLAIHNRPSVPDIYKLGNGELNTASMTQVTALPAEFETTVHQYAADYYRLIGDEPVTIDFTGSLRTPLLDTTPPSGRHFWYASRTNYSHMRLTRALDLSAVVTATLNYSVYHDIEYSYDFAYVSVSEDGGATWKGLEAQQMQGLNEADNPAGKALTERFYTGQSEGWLHETIDLTPYAGQEILIRFSYVTDPILTFGGLALDNVSVPQIGFYDSAEVEESGWTAEGFVRTTPTLPQTWHLQLITFSGDVPAVTLLEVDEEQRVSHRLDLGASGEEAILIVAASAPQTLEPAHYHLNFTR